MDAKELQELLKLVNRLELAEFKFRQGDTALSVRTKFFSKAQPVMDSGASYMPMPSAMTPSAPVPSAQPTAKESSTAEPSGDNGESSGGAAKDNLVEIRSPIVGTFYRSPNPEKGPYVKPGDKVEVGSVVCIVEAMKLFNEIESEVSGTVVKVVVEDASPVEYDQLLFLIDPNG